MRATTRLWVGAIPGSTAVLGVAYRNAPARSRIGDVQVTAWYFADCPNWRLGERRLRQALALIGCGDADVRLVPVTTEAEATRGRVRRVADVHRRWG